jgi:hypothetical protein
MQHIKDIESFNAGIIEAVKVLRQQFFAGNLEGGEGAINLLEKKILPVIAENGVFSTQIPDSVEEIEVEAADLLA